MNINISNHPQFAQVKRVFEFKNLVTDLQNIAKIQGITKHYIEVEEEVNGEKQIIQKTPLGFNPNGEYKELIADSTTLVNSATGQYSLEGDMTEIDYLKSLPIEAIKQALQKETLSVGEVLEWLVMVSVQKQDAYKRFDK